MGLRLSTSLGFLMAGPRGLNSYKIELLLVVFQIERICHCRTGIYTLLAKFYWKVVGDKNFFVDTLGQGLYTPLIGGRQSLVRVCSSLKTDGTAHLHPAQPVSVPLPSPRETSSAVTTYEAVIQVANGVI